MDDRFDKIEAKLDKVLDKVGSLEVTAAKQEVNLCEHMKRSDTLEKMHNNLKEDVEPLKASVNKIMGGWKLFIYVIIPLAAAVLTTMHFFK